MDTVTGEAYSSLSDEKTKEGLQNPEKRLGPLFKGSDLPFELSFQLPRQTESSNKRGLSHDFFSKAQS